MNSRTLPIDTAAYEHIPISVMLCEPVAERDGTVTDYRLVYGNREFVRKWRELFSREDYLGTLAVGSQLLDDSVLRKVKPRPDGTLPPFSAILSYGLMHLHFQPIPNLPAPYVGFFLTDITDYGSEDARMHFLHNIRQMNANCVLIRRHDNGSLECVYASDSFAQMMECNREQARQMMDGVKFLKSTHPEDRPFVRSMLRRRVTDDGSSDLTIQKITAHRNYIWCRVHYAFIDDFNKHYILCTYTDVTALKQYEERLRSVYVNLGNNFYQSNEKTLALLRVNLTKNTVEEAKGPDLYPADSVRYPYSEVLSRRAEYYPIRTEQERFLHTFHRDQLSEGYSQGRVMASQVLYTRRQNGLMCYTKLSATVTRHPLSGDMIAFITEEECNSEKVRETLMSKILARQFDMLAYLVGGRYGVTIGDRSRIKRGSIFPASRRGGYQHYLNSQVAPVISGSSEDRARILRALSMEEIEKQTRDHEPYVVDVPIEMDGGTFDKRFDFYTVDPEARFYIILKSDTTELQREQRQRNEQLRLALEEAKQANAAKSAFLSSMSHEIRTPMNAIIGLDTIALKDPDLPGHTRENLEKIGVSARHLLGLINDILDMSRIESGRMDLKHEEFSFQEFLEQINTLVSGQCEDKGLWYRCSVQGKVDDFYIGDDMKLKQVLINMLGNAVKFTEAPGSVTLLVEQTARFEDKATLRFVVEDTGIGMDPEYLPRIFDPFSQEDATTTNRYGGSGLGMAITKNIVEMMNGSVSVQSEKGKGSRFTVNVTLRASDRTAAGDQTFRPQDMRVLVVDDDPVARDHAKIVLEEIGISADVCQSGDEAMDLVRLRHARREAYNLILLDLRMPKQDGLQLTRQIREQYSGDESAIILVTAYNWSEVEEDARAAGVDGFMTKPLFAGNLLHEFRQAINRRLREIPPERTADLTGRRVLLAEDMEINAEIMMELLDMREIKAEHAENGKIAVEMFDRSEPGWYDAVLMDVRMPEMDGLQAAAAIRALDRPDAKAVPIIAMTANAFDEDVERSLQAGMNAHLTKPVDPERLFETLGSLIQS